jgi:hypothetical protein
MANVKITELTEATAPTTDDYVVLVDDPSGTPVTKRSTLANMLTVALTAIRALTPAANKLPVYTSGSAATALEITEQTVLGRLTGGSIKAISRTELTALLNAATDSLQGAAPLASDAEVIAGTDDAKIVTSAGLAAKLDTDGTLAGNLDTRIATQKAVKTYVDNPREVDGHASGSLSAADVLRTIIHNIGQGANDVELTLPAAAAGMKFRAAVGEPSANAWKFTAAVAGTMVVDGAYGKDYAQYATPGLGNFFDAFTVKSVPQPVGMLTGAALAIGSTKTNVYSGAFTYYIDGVKYAKAEVAAGTAPGNDVIPQNKYGAVAFDIGADGTIDVVEATDNATGYDSAVLAVAGLPAVEAAHVRIGYVTAMCSTGNFTFGTTDLDAADTTVAYTSTAAYTPGYNWVVKTGAGTVTTS